MTVYYLSDDQFTPSRPVLNADEAAVAAVLARYEEALNRSDVAAVMALYAADGVFMPQNKPSSVGMSAVRRAYDDIFEAITLRVTFDVLEVHVVAPSWAFARTTSAGRTTVHVTGESAAEANQELFVFCKVDAAWKIARYCFSSTNPATAEGDGSR